MKKVSSSPHIHSGESTRRIMLDVIIALAPACIWGVFSFGFRALLVLALSTITSVLTEFLLGKVSKENTIGDLSAVVTGMLVGMNMSPTIPLFIPCIASFFAIAVAKWTFGGLGANWANPAIAGRVFVFFSFTSAMSSFKLPRLLCVADAVSSATPLSIIKTAVTSGNYTGLHTNEILAAQAYPVSSFAEKLGSVLGISAYDIDAFIGNIPGCIGEISTLLLLAGFIYLLIRKVVTIWSPLFYLGFFSVLTWIFGGIPNGLGFFEGDVLSSLLRGGIILGAFFMATDMVTTPITHKGMAIFGAGCGILTFLFRSFGSLPEAASIAILMMNIVTPTIDKFVKPHKFGDSAKKIRKGAI